MMTWLFLIAEVLFKPRESAAFLIKNIVGYFSIIIGGVIGLYFLFQFLVPLIGYLEAGALFCAFFLLIGGVFLILGRQKPKSPVNDLLSEAQKVLKDLQVDKTIKENAPKIILFSLVAGLLLSQLKDVMKQLRRKT